MTKTTVSESDVGCHAIGETKDVIYPPVDKACNDNE